MIATNRIEKDEYYPFPDGAPRRKIYQNRHLALYRYQGKSNTSETIPVCIVFALVNKPYMLDLSPKRSFIRALVEQGLTIHLIEWKDPSVNPIAPTLEDYFNSLDQAITMLNKEYQATINLLGICQGGTISTIYTSLYPDKVRNLITMVTPVDFHAGDNILAHSIKYCDTSMVRKTWKYIPGHFMNSGFLLLKPFELLISKYRNAIKMWNKKEQKELFLRMEKWIFDTPPQSSVAWEKFVRECYQQNNLIHKRMELGGQIIDLSRIKCPTLNITGQRDHLVLELMSIPLNQAISSQDYKHQSYPVGHIGIFVGGMAQKTIAPDIASWTKER